MRDERFLKVRLLDTHDDPEAREEYGLTCNGLSVRLPLFVADPTANLPAALAIIDEATKSDAVNVLRPEVKAVWVVFLKLTMWRSEGARIEQATVKLRE